MVNINEIPQELIEIHKEWFEIFVKERIKKLESKTTIKIKNEDVEIDKIFLEEIKNWLKIDMAVSDKLIEFIDSFKNKFKDIDEYFFYEHLKEKFQEQIENSRTIWNRYKESDILDKVELEKIKAVLLETLVDLEEKKKTVLEDFINDIKINKRGSSLNKEKINEVFKKLIDDKKLEDKLKVIKYIFYYNHFSNKENFKTEKGETKKWARHEFLTKLGVTVCPYCNRQYINNYSENNEDKTTADLDHFYIQSLYPYLALSIYNFIPSCQICNRTFKGATNFFDGENHNHIYPYKEGFKNKAKFTLGFNKDYDLNVLLGMSDNFKVEFKFDCDGDTKSKIKNSIETFKLDKIYSINHRDYVKDLIRKAIIYNQTRIDELYSQYGNLFSSREEVWIMVLGNYIDSDDLGKRPLAKLTKDIMEELGIK